MWWWLRAANSNNSNNFRNVNNDGNNNNWNNANNTGGVAPDFCISGTGYGKNVLVNSSVPLKIRKDWFFLGEYSPKVNDGCYAWTLLAWFKVLTYL